MPDLSPSKPLTRRQRSLLYRVFVLLASALGLYLLIAYILMPTAWRWHSKRHPALDEIPRIAHTRSGIPGDPLNLALIGTEEELIKAMIAADWHAADPITWRSSVKIAISTMFHRPDETAPVSNLFVWGKKQDLAFEQQVGKDARKRHHVRFWRSEMLDDQGRPLWAGSDTFDERVGFSHTTGQITHHVDGDVDTERDRLLEQLKKAGVVAELTWIDDFQQIKKGRNGGGDAWHTDGRLPVVTLGEVKKTETEE